MSTNTQPTSNPATNIYDAYKYVRRAEMYYDVMDGISLSQTKNPDDGQSFITKFLEDNKAVAPTIVLNDANEALTYENFTRNVTQDAAAMLQIKHHSQKLDLSNPDNISKLDTIVRYGVQGSSTDTSNSGISNISPEPLLLAAQYNELKADINIEDFQAGTKDPSTDSKYYSTHVENQVLETLRDLRRDSAGRYDLHEHPENGAVRKRWESNRGDTDTPPISTNIWNELIAPYHTETVTKPPKTLDIQRTLRNWLKEQVATEISGQKGEEVIAEITNTLNVEDFNPRTKAWKDVLHQLRGQTNMTSSSVAEHYAEFTTTLGNSSLDDDLKATAQATINKQAPTADTSVTASATSSQPKEIRAPGASIGEE